MREEIALSSHPRLDISSSGITAEHRKTRVFVPVDARSWDGIVKADYEPLKAPIAEAITAAGLRGRNLVVSYDSRDSAVEMLTLPMGSTEAQAAATLRVRESLGGSLVPSQVTSARVPSGKSNATTTLLLAGERTALIDRIASLVRAGGAVPVTLIPARACTLRSAIASVLTQDSGRTTAVLWLDRHHSALAGGVGGLCSFARTLGGSFELLVEAFRRASNASDGCDAEQACEVLLRCGIPARGKSLEETLNLHGDKVLPAIQPVLQRLAVEIKQTLRFGLPEGESTRAELILVGPGSVIPGLADALAGLTEISIKTPAVAGDAKRERIEALMNLGITPLEIERRRSTRRIVAAAAIGAVAAGLAITVDAMWSRQEIVELREQVAKNALALDVVNANLATRDRIEVLKTTVGRLDSLADATLGHQPSWAAGLALTSRLGVPGLELHEVTGLSSNDGPTLVIKGLLPSPEGSPNPVSELIEKLGSSPLVSQVRIGSSRLVESEGTRSLQFAVTVFLRTLDPGEIVRVSATNETEGVTP